MKVSEVGLFSDPDDVCPFVLGLPFLSFILSGIVGLIFQSHAVFSVLFCISIPTSISLALVLIVSLGLQEKRGYGPDANKKYLELVDRFDLVKTLLLCIFWPFWLCLGIYKGVKMLFEPVVETFKTIVEVKNEV